MLTASNSSIVIIGISALNTGSVATLRNRQIVATSTVNIIPDHRIIITTITKKYIITPADLWLLIPGQASSGVG